MSYVTLSLLGGRYQLPPLSFKTPFTSTSKVPFP